MPDEGNGVMKFLEKMHATSRNVLFASDDTGRPASAVRSEVGVRRTLYRLARSRWQGYYQKPEAVNTLELHRIFVANLPPLTMPASIGIGPFSKLCLVKWR
jgi:hypothetical protein